MQTLIKIGDEAKGFRVKDQDDKEFKLSDFQGKKVLLSFHPLAERLRGSNEGAGGQ